MWRCCWLCQTQPSVPTHNPKPSHLNDLWMWLFKPWQSRFKNASFFIATSCYVECGPILREIHPEYGSTIMVTSGFFLKPSMVLMHELVVTLPDKHTKHYLHLRLFYIGLFKLACFLDPIMSIYFIPESPTKGLELSTLTHQLSPFMYINVHSAMSVNPSSGFEWIEFLKVSPHPMKWKFMDAYCGNKWSELDDDDLLIVCLGMLPS